MVIVKIDGKYYDIYHREKEELDKAVWMKDPQHLSTVISAIKGNHRPLEIKEYKSKTKSK